MNNNGKSYRFKKLKEYSPPESVWEGIEKAISDDKKLGRQLKKLKEYTPDEQVWNRIKPQIPRKQFTISRSIKWLAAASVALFMLGSTWQLVRVKKQKINLEAVIENYHSDTDEAFSTLEAFCLNQNVVCTEPGFTSLKSAYENLKKEEERVRKNARKFDSESDLLKQLNSIEQKKTEVLNQMANLI